MDEIISRDKNVSRLHDSSMNEGKEDYQFVSFLFALKED